MKVAYYLDLPTEQYLWFARNSIRRTRKFAHGAEIILLTTQTFPNIPLGEDRVERVALREDCFYGYRKCKAQSMIDGECLFMDVDCIMHKDVSHIFDAPFDVALCVRYLSKAVDKLPFNGGVAFSRSPQFWSDVAGVPDDHKTGADTERRFSEVAMSGKYFVRALNGNVFNYSPPEPDSDISDKAIVHYKGDRKAWLFDRSFADEA